MQKYDFDEIIERRGTNCNKWDDMEATYGVSSDDGLAMWVADMDFRPPETVQAAVEKLAAHGVYGYPAGHPGYLPGIQWWMEERHGWRIEQDWILTALGLVNGTALAVSAFSEPGDRVILMTPVYHAFARVIRGQGREVAEFPLATQDGRYVMDWAAWETLLTGREKILILCSPHNPGGRVWTEAELQEVAAFCQAHDLILVSDEIHHDLVMPGHKHSVMAKAAPDIADRLITLTAATKTFNIAGAHIGNAIISDPKLRAAYKAQLAGLGLSTGMFGTDMVAAAYSPEGARWVDALVAYLDNNRKLFDDGINSIPGLASMPLEATYLSWVDFAGTGMEPAEVKKRIASDARIAANAGETFGLGGESYMRFNLATPRCNVEEAVTRLRSAFADLQ
ncbi:MalY/PatB family protein [Paracoccus sp. SCSIO 75233]|uniref:MalY/PatB family protein n=1 Tax=Paracoccus sp. SCSIO 75233 TaxID=3017782 RepID=UPI0022F045F2|nr:MalY/PatB family protein [Paracoccus sp. SCSIO 75233]WBU53859.1 pyridoxal phosphate-dependent aminotransferase [Paracoccus sp. SCSIO 75233]